MRRPNEKQLEWITYGASGRGEGGYGYSFTIRGAYRQCSQCRSALVLEAHRVTSAHLTLEPDERGLWITPHAADCEVAHR